MRGLPATLTLDGHTAKWVWGTLDDPRGADEPRIGAVPAGMLIDHGDHTLLVPWVALDGVDVVPFTLDSLLPLTLLERVACAICGDAGFVRAGAWVPESEVARG